MSGSSVRSVSSASTISSTLTPAADGASGLPTNGSVSTAGSPTTPTAAAAALRMLKLTDRQSGVCMFTSTWKWHPHGHEEGVDALVQSFAQFAREIDGGEVVRVHFDCNPSRVSSGSVGNVTPTPSSMSGDDRRMSYSCQSSTNAVEMVTHQTAEVQAVLFHDRVPPMVATELHSFLARVTLRFVELMQDELVRVRPLLTATMSASETTDAVAVFAPFEDVLEKELVPTLSQSSGP
ncbi:hypothetical protein P43SY_003372 [Pythium insidiosum]|uniref:Uncharacterized protein n=1 Tax=Pythium insidiosum TaxID=114742 RepID=A0AAD5Q681_PYTIN|nr:hypothetical protein P43SY_003372 [Pythium insidiosum]KAJ0401883.1 hypothetical protein ATCC90586_003491 [Pythium insidiosum]